MYYKIRITHTSKRVGTDDGYHTDYEDTHNFKTLEKAQEFIADRYKKSQQKTEVFIDTDNGSVQTGWIYGFRDTAFNRGEPPYHYFGEDWVTIHKVEEKPIIKHFTR